MKPLRVLLTLIMLAGTLSFAGAQQTNRALQSYQDRFRDATPEVKLQIVQTADLLPVSELGPLYVQALQFALSNSGQLSSDVLLQKIVLVAAQKVQEGGYSPAVGSLWSLFAELVDTTSRIAVLDALGGIGVGNKELVLDLNGWVQAQANLYRGGVMPDLPVLQRAVITLGKLGDVSAFPVLLDVQLAQTSGVITASARDAMKSLPGDYVEHAIQTVNRRTISNQLPALEFFLGDPDLTDEERARIAAGVMREAVRTSTRDLTDQSALRQVRFRAAQELIDIPYGPAADSLIRHLNMTFQSYDQGLITKTWVVDAITALGNTGSDAAATRLTRLLDLLNSYTENSRPYDTQIILAVVNSLGRLGNHEAYDALFYATLLDYPQIVKDAARAALAAVSR